MIQLGNNNIQAISIGGGNISKMYKGDKLVFGSEDKVVVPAPSFDANGYDYVDMGDAGIWATCNIGASKPEEYGLYFAWGETIGYPDASSGKKFNWDDYKFAGSSGYPTKYYSSTDGLKTLELEDDAAHVNMRGDWRMPTTTEFETLDRLCNNEWTDDYKGTGVTGRIFKLKTDESKQLFFPAAGTCNDGSVNGAVTHGSLWSSSLHWEEYSAEMATFYKSGFHFRSALGRTYGFSIRGFIPKPE